MTSKLSENDKQIVNYLRRSPADSLKMDAADLIERLAAIESTAMSDAEIIVAIHKIDDLAMDHGLSTRAMPEAIAIIRALFLEKGEIMTDKILEQEPIAWMLESTDKDGMSWRDVFHSKLYKESHIKYNTEVHGFKVIETPLYKKVN